MCGVQLFRMEVGSIKGSWCFLSYICDFCWWRPHFYSCKITPSVCSVYHGYSGSEQDHHHALGHSSYWRLWKCWEIIMFQLPLSFLLLLSQTCGLLSFSHSLQFLVWCKWLEHWARIWEFLIWMTTLPWKLSGCPWAIHMQFNIPQRVILKWRREWSKLLWVPSGEKGKE